jgi:sialic acid synthase SpsE
MKKNGLILVFFFFLFAAMSHPPKSLSLKFDLKSQELQVNIEHGVSDVTNHYISNVVVAVNGKEVLNQNYTIQKNNKSEDILFKLENINKNDLIEVTATCVKWGKKSQILTVE